MPKSSVIKEDNWLLTPSLEHCSASIPDYTEDCTGDSSNCGWVTNNDDTDDSCWSNIFDCNGDCNGSAYVDDCGVCDSDASNDGSDKDLCGVCFGDNSTCTFITGFDDPESNGNNPHCCEDSQTTFDLRSWHFLDIQLEGHGLDDIDEVFLVSGANGSTLDVYIWISPNGSSTSRLISIDPYSYPYDLINYNLLTNFEKNYLFKYHLNVYSKISKYLNSNEKKWLASLI